MTGEHVVSSASSGDVSPVQSRRSRVLIVDDHAIFRDGLKLLFHGHADLIVCGEASTAAEALREMERTLPDIAILDLVLPDTNGIELISRVGERFPELPVLVLSMYPSGLYAERVLKAGAAAYVEKFERSSVLLETVRSVLAGRTARRGNTPVAGDEDTHDGSISELSDRELVVYELCGRGLSRSEIASKLGISPKTVEAHREHIKMKLGIRKATELVSHAAIWLERHGRN